MELNIDPRIKNLLKIIVSLSLIIYIVYNIGIFKIIHHLRNVRLKYFLLAILIGVFNVAISAKKWQILLKAKDENKSFVRTWKIYYIGNFFNLFLPTNVGGDVVKAHKMSKETKDSVEAYSSVFMERFTGLIAVLILAISATSLYIRGLPLHISIIVFCIFTPLIIVAIIFLAKKSLVKKFRRIYLKVFSIFNPFSLKEKVEKLYDSINLYKKKKRALSLALTLSLLFQTLLILNNYILALSLGLDIPIHYFFIFIPICVVLLFLPISIKGFGVREVLYVYFFTKINVAPAEAISLSFLVQIVGILMSIIGGLVYIYSKLNKTALEGHSSKCGEKK